MPTAHVGYQPAGVDLYGCRVKAAYHAITDEAVKTAAGTCYAGEPLCETAWRWADIPDGLFPPLVTCQPCRNIAVANGITIIEGDAA